jgi:phospholipid-binding lipoprotein MlaA
MNRYFFEVNRGLDELFLKPAAAAYNAALPYPVQDSVRAFINNLRSPIILANDILQGEGDRAYVTLSRFLINTTIGILGVFDVATEIGLDYHDEDFGQTMAVAGVDPGPYLMIPLLGPSNPRDLAGKVVDLFFDPLSYIASPEERFGKVATDTVDYRNRNRKAIEALEEGSVDFYSTVRDASRQRRQDEIRNRRDNRRRPQGSSWKTTKGTDWWPEQRSRPESSSSSLPRRCCARAAAPQRRTSWRPRTRRSSSTSWGRRRSSP